MTAGTKQQGQQTPQRSERRRTVTANGKVVWKMKDDAGALKVVSLKCQTAGELLAEDIRQRGFLLDPWLREAESVLLYAPTGAGKSFLALSAAIAVADGGKLLGWAAGTCPETHDGKGWRVIYVDGEMHLGDLQERLRGLLAGAEGTNREQVLSNLTLISRQGQSGEGWFPSITDTEGVAFYRNLVREHDADLIVFDNFSTLGEVEDENAASSFNAIVTTLLSLKQMGVATMLVHHAGKNGNMRGSTKLAATFEVIVKLDVKDKWLPVNPWSVAKTADADGDERGAAFLTCFEKMRSGERPAEVYASLKSVPRFEGGRSLQWSYKSATNPRLCQIREGLEEAQWATQQEIAHELGVDPGTISRDLQAGYKFGMWTRPWITSQLAAGLKKAGGRLNSWDTAERAAEF
jgi:hypothetical protein